MSARQSIFEAPKEFSDCRGGAKEITSERVSGLAIDTDGVALLVCAANGHAQKGQQGEPTHYIPFHNLKNYQRLLFRCVCLEAA